MNSKVFLFIPIRADFCIKKPVFLASGNVAQLIFPSKYGATQAWIRIHLYLLFCHPYMETFQTANTVGT